MIVGRAHDLVPQVARAYFAVHPVAVVALVGAGVHLLAPRPGFVRQLDVGVMLDCHHECIGDANRDVEVGELALVLGMDEFLDVGMVATQHAHLRAAPRAGRLHCLA